MAQGISVALPLDYNKEDGPFRLNKTIQDSVKQNFKNLVLTIPGERIMDPSFGVGLYSFLFENFTKGTTHDIQSQVDEQVKKYMPFINVQQVIVTESKTNINQFYIYIKYSINSLNALDELSFVISK